MEPPRKHTVQDFSYDPFQWALSRLQICDNTLGDMAFDRPCPLEEFAFALDFTPLVSLGRLDILPTETIGHILLCLDVFSLLKFRRVNRLAYLVAASLPELDLIKRQFPIALRALMSTQARHIDILSLYRTLCSSRCATCDSFGGYLYLAGCCRVCYTCFTERPEFCPIMLEDVCWDFDSWEELEHAPHILAIPGNYTATRLRLTGRQGLWDRGSVEQRMKITFPPDRSDRHWRDPRRFSVVMPIPRLQPRLESAEWPVYCMGCSCSWDPKRSFRTQYTPQDFLDHIAAYGPVSVEHPADRSWHRQELAISPPTKKSPPSSAKSVVSAPYLVNVTDQFLPDGLGVGLFNPATAFA